MLLYTIAALGDFLEAMKELLGPREPVRFIMASKVLGNIRPDLNALCRERYVSMCSRLAKEIARLIKQRKDLPIQSKMVSDSSGHFLIPCLKKKLFYMGEFRFWEKFNRMGTGSLKWQFLNTLTREQKKTLCNDNMTDALQRKGRENCRLLDELCRSLGVREL